MIWYSLCTFILIQIDQKQDFLILVYFKNKMIEFGIFQSLICKLNNIYI